MIPHQCMSVHPRKSDDTPPIYVHPRKSDNDIYRVGIRRPHMGDTYVPKIHICKTVASMYVVHSILRRGSCHLVAGGGGVKPSSI